MDTLDFLEFSKKCREDFLDKMSDLKELNIEMLPRNEDSFYLRKLYEAYDAYLHNLYDEYTKESNIGVSFDSIVYDFLTTISDQCNDASYITFDERALHITCIEYNIIVDIHKFSYELYSRNHELNERDFFHGTSLSELLLKDMCTIEQFRNESFYDIDNFNHITIPDDIEYLKESKMIDIYLLNEVSDIKEKKDYDDFFNLMYTFKSKGMISKSLYRYLITLEDVLYAKKGIVRSLSYTLVAVALLLSGLIFIASTIL